MEAVNCKFAVIADPHYYSEKLGVSGESYSDAKIKQNKTYYYKVAAVNDTQGELSTSVNATTLQNCIECCKKVTYLRNCNGYLYRCYYYTNNRCNCCD